jgi:hypothetical protein
MGGKCWACTSLLANCRELNILLYDITEFTTIGERACTGLLLLPCSRPFSTQQQDPIPRRHRLSPFACWSFGRSSEILTHFQKEGSYTEATIENCKGIRWETIQFDTSSPEDRQHCSTAVTILPYSRAFVQFMLRDNSVSSASGLMGVIS